MIWYDMILMNNEETCRAGDGTCGSGVATDIWAPPMIWYDGHSIPWEVDDYGAYKLGWERMKKGLRICDKVSMTYVVVAFKASPPSFFSSFFLFSFSFSPFWICLTIMCQTTKCSVVENNSLLSVYIHSTSLRLRGSLISLHLTTSKWNIFNLLISKKKWITYLKKISTSFVRTEVLFYLVLTLDYFGGFWQLPNAVWTHRRNNLIFNLPINKINTWYILNMKIYYIMYIWEAGAGCICMRNGGLMFS